MKGTVIAPEIAIKGLQQKFDGDIQTLLMYSRVDVVDVIQSLKSMEGFEDGVNSGGKLWRQNVRWRLQALLGSRGKAMWILLSSSKGGSPDQICDLSSVNNEQCA